jgi:hypothetical protein
MQSKCSSSGDRKAANLKSQMGQSSLSATVFSEVLLVK